MPAFRVSYLATIDEISAQRWNAVAATDYPFARHEFLAALEHSGAVAPATGWQPQHALLWDHDELVAVMPLYLKYHSWGEYVFDWAWAEAAERCGVDWYPKLVATIPFTPATGPRLCVASGYSPATAAAALVTALRQRIETEALSSLHILFPSESACELLAEQRLAVRHGAQYHWFNQGYASWDAFLGTLNSRKRKGIRRERQRVAEQGITLRALPGTQVTASEWRAFYHFYQLTYARHSGHGGYLPEKFFQEIGRTLGDQVVLVLADHDGRPVAGSLYFRDTSTLYGRYWGCSDTFDQLHFEACYYQGIEYCIREGLARFDPGAQGEHKIQRGFRPVTTYSCHWVEERRLREAIDDFLARERIAIAAYIQEASAGLPFRRAGDGG